MQPEALTATLSALAPKLAPGADRATDLRRLSGGASQETYSFQVEGPGVTRALILRRRPDGASTGSGIPLSTEAALIRAADAAGAPVPPVPHVCEEADGVGEAYVMGRVEGETLGARIVRHADFARVRGGLAAQCGAVLAAIHTVQTADLPPLETRGAAEDIARYEEIYRGSGHQRPVFDYALEHLKRNMPEPPSPADGGGPVLVHGDFRNGNIMVHPEHGLVAALDWELGHLGDPAEDLGWLCANSWRFGGDGPVGGFGSYQQLLDGYASTGREPPSLKRVQAWQMIGSLRWGVMCLMMYVSQLSTAEPSLERAMIGRRASECEIDLVNLLEAA